MKRTHLTELSIDELVNTFTRVSIAQADALLSDEIARFNKLYGQMDRIADELKRREGDARHALMRLYGHPNYHVRLNAANRTLAVAPEEACGELRAIASSRHYPEAARAASALRYLNEGIYRPT